MRDQFVAFIERRHETGDRRESTRPDGGYAGRNGHWPLRRRRLKARGPGSGPGRWDKRAPPVDPVAPDLTRRLDPLSTTPPPTRPGPRPPCPMGGLIGDVACSGKRVRDFGDKGAEQTSQLRSPEGERAPPSRKCGKQLNISLKFDALEPHLQRMEFCSRCQAFRLPLRNQGFGEQQRRRTCTGQLDDLTLIRSKRRHRDGAHAVLSFGGLKVLSGADERHGSSLPRVSDCSRRITTSILAIR